MFSPKMNFLFVVHCHISKTQIYLTNSSDHTMVCQTVFFFLRHFTPGSQWPYHGLTDRVFLNPVCETVVWSLADWVKNLIEKKWPGLSDCDMVTGELRNFKIFVKF